MRLASFIAKGKSGDPTALPARATFAMATRLGAQALHLGHVTGSLEPGKRADLVVIEHDTLHNSPHFGREPDAIYARLVYAMKSTDVTDVMVNGRWLMRARKLLTIEEAPLLEAAADYAGRIDTFLIEREESVLSKLVAIEGAVQEESYEVQIKVRLDDPAPVIEALSGGPFEIVRRAHYQEYDTYFLFDDASQGRLRHREDEFLGEDGDVFKVRYRLTLTGPAAELEFPNSVLLSRSRFLAPATHGLRFYREYFKPSGEIEIHKERLRWLVRFRGVEFFVNIDRVSQPENEDWFLEVKARTWSRRDAQDKAALISDLLAELGTAGSQVVRQEYPELLA
jgi:5-methylthioadenosine/S-adenosylhomocysteine deaminase